MAILGDSKFPLLFSRFCLIADVYQNDHQRGDQWNGEDLSIFSTDDQTLPVSPLPHSSELNQSTSSLAKSTRKEVEDETSVTPGNLKRVLTNPSIASTPTSQNPELTNAPGYRAAEAYVRPAPITTNGPIIDYTFDLKNCEFTMEIEGTKAESDEFPTTVFLPEYHFPKDQCTVAVSSGKWEISTDDEERTWIQKLRWWHGDGKQSLKITGIIRPHNTLAGTAEEAGYLQQCQESYVSSFKDCTVM